MNTQALTNQVFILFLLMFIGFIARKTRLLNNELNTGLNELIVNITVPFSIVTSFNISYSPETLHNIIVFFLCCVAVHLIAALAGWLLFLRVPENERKLFRFIAIFSNCGYMGLPVLASIFGNSGIFYGSIYVVTFNLFAWTLGVMVFTGKADRTTVKQGLTNPALIAVAIGLVLFLFSLKLPVPIYRSLEITGGMTTPLAMMVIGSMLADIHLQELFSGFVVYYISLVRLVIIPLLAAFSLKAVGVRPELVQICTASAAMPAAALTAVFAEKYNNNTKLTSRIIFISTALSIVTLPLVLMIV